MSYPIVGIPIRQNTITADLSASGEGFVDLPNNNSAVQLVILQASVITNPTSNAFCTVTPPVGIVDTSYFAGTGDKANGPYLIDSGDYLRFTFTGGPSLGKGIVTYQFQEVPF